jgi:PAS domain S-box-containing protein
MADSTGASDAERHECWRGKAGAKPMRLLIVDDDLAVRRLVCNRLEKQGVSVTSAATSAAALAELRRSAFDVAILDLTLPDGSGLDVLRALRVLNAPTHVIILSGAGSEVDRVRALDLGADDYVVKPFFVRELTARVLAVRRRQDIGKDTRLQHGRIVIDLAARQVTVDHEPVDLTAKEFDLFAFLAARPRHVFSREELLHSVWQSATEGQQAATVTEHVGRLRAKIEVDARQPRVLKTVRGVGYRFDPPAAEPLDAEPAIPSARASDGREGIFVLVDGRVVAADDAAIQMLGVTGEAELLGRVASEMVAPQSLHAARARLQATASGESPGAQVMEVRRADGSDIFVEVSSSRTEWNGQPARRLTLHPSTDPSARLRRLVTGVFSEVSDAVIVTDPHLHVRSWNHAAERLYGWSEQEVLGRHLYEVVPLAAADDVLSSAMRTLETTGRWFGECQQIARDGSLVDVRASTTLVRDDAGEPVVFVSVNRRVPDLANLAAPRATDAREEAEIRRGLDSAEFVVHYQPVVAFDDLHLITLEALVRWNHPVRGLLAPDAFIDTAERTGLIVDLGRAVFDQACHQTAEWRRAGSAISVAVNLSTRQFADAALFDDITGTLAVSGLDPQALWLEVTETALVEDLDQATNLLERLAARGIGIAIDDFGTGWASLTYLKQFPVHALKIDRTFVAGVDHNPQDAAIARSIISLAHELDMIVVAEGVETLAQQGALQALGCSIGQGFLYGRPSPAAGVAIERARRL